jgi:hypothetical protein
VFSLRSNPPAVGRLTATRSEKRDLVPVLPGNGAGRDSGLAGHFGPKPHRVRQHQRVGIRAANASFAIVAPPVRRRVRSRPTSRDTSR